MRRRSSRRRYAVWSLALLGFLAVFAVGLALGQALHDSSPPAGTRTSVRTLSPLTLSADTVTVTVTVTTAP